MEPESGATQESGGAGERSQPIVSTDKSTRGPFVNIFAKRRPLYARTTRSTTESGRAGERAQAILSTKWASRGPFVDMFGKRRPLYARTTRPTMRERESDRAGERESKRAGFFIWYYLVIALPLSRSPASHSPVLLLSHGGAGGPSV